MRILWDIMLTLLDGTSMKASDALVLDFLITNN
jgi:hypothetical protein